MIKVSIIMPVYNVESYLERSIESVLAQDFEDWELVIVNDGSTDASGEICKEYADQDRRIRYFYQENQGSGIARNKGLDKVRSNYICFIDPDDYIKSNFIQNNLKIMEREEPEIVVNGYSELFEENKIVERYYTKLRGLYSQEKLRDNYNKFEEISVKSLCNKMYKKSFLEKHNIRFTGQRVGQDALFNYEVYKYVSKIYINNKSFYVYDSRRAGSATNRYNANLAIYEMNIANKYREMFDSWGRAKDYKENIARYDFRVLLAELINLNRKDCPDNLKTKIKKIEELFENERISKSLALLNIQDMETIFLKNILFLAKKRKTLLLLFLHKIYVAIKM